MDTVLFMLKAIIQEAAALASLSLFIAMIAIWTQVWGICEGGPTAFHLSCATSWLGAAASLLRAPSHKFHIVHPPPSDSAGV